AVGDGQDSGSRKWDSRSARGSRLGLSVRRRVLAGIDARVVFEELEIGERRPLEAPEIEEEGDELQRVDPREALFVEGANTAELLCRRQHVASVVIGGLHLEGL